MRGPVRTPDSAFWVDPGDVDETRGRLTLDADESRHLLRVFRAEPGTAFEAIDGDGHLFRCVLDSADAGIATGRIESRLDDAGELGASITLLVGLPDLPQIESIVSLAVPLGATRLDFVAVARRGREALPEPRIERLRRIARSALKQSRRTRMPEIESSRSLREGVSAAPPASLRFVADPAGEPLRDSDLKSLGTRPQVSISLAVGPPGGFLFEEAGLLRGLDFAPMSLGPNRLTTSAACIALLAGVRNLLLARGLGRVDRTGLSGYL